MTWMFTIQNPPSASDYWRALNLVFKELPGTEQRRFLVAKNPNSVVWQHKLRDVDFKQVLTTLQVNCLIKLFNVFILGKEKLLIYVIEFSH